MKIRQCPDLIVLFLLALILALWLIESTTREALRIIFFRKLKLGADLIPSR